MYAGDDCHTEKFHIFATDFMHASVGKTQQPPKKLLREVQVHNSSRTHDVGIYIETIIRHMTITKNSTQSFLEHIRDIVRKDKNDTEYQKREGNIFNLFNILNIKADELVHSSMIAALVDPHGMHGQGSIFLEKFLNIWDFGFELDTKTASVTTEYTIGPINKSYTTGGRIDILITDAQNHAIIIENKVNASDQKNQLKRYANFGKSKNYEFAIIYLTLDGHEPSILSTGKSCDHDYVMFSYRDDVLPWLDECMKVCKEGSTLHGSIYQYSQCIRTLLNLMNTSNEENLIEVATRKENVDSVLALFANERSIKKRIIEDFTIKICGIAKELGFETHIDDGFCEEKGTFITFSIPSKSNKWALYIGTYKGTAKDIQYEIALMEDASSKIKKTDLKDIPHLWKTFEQDKNTPCGWSFFWSESGKKYSGKWYDWYDTETQQAMVDGRLLNFIVEKILIPVIESNVFAKLDKF